MRTVAINDKGLRIGEDHQRAKLTNKEVELIRELREEGLTYKSIADKFEIAKTTVAQICRYERRSQIAAAWRLIKRG